VWINKNEIKTLSEDIRKVIDGQEIDLRNNQEGPWSILRNDIHTLATLKNEQVQVLKQESIFMKDTLENISHQLKTPLTSMIIMAELLEDAPAAKREEFLTNIKNSLFHTEWLVSALLKMAKLDAKAVTFQQNKITAEALIERALEPLQILLEIKEQKVEILGEIHLHLYCDLAWTAEALTNILKNAMEHSPVHSTIKVQYDENPICKWISVTDAGEGIPKGQMKGIFQRFTGDKSKKGHGIGLPLGLAIMQGQNGDIEIEPGGNGQGAIFVMKFYPEMK
jgi:K+-sensing histidine kinase KdpD